VIVGVLGKIVGELRRLFYGKNYSKGLGKLFNETK